MIQRIQTLYLLLALIACILLPFFPIAVFQSSEFLYKMYIHKIMINTQDITEVFKMDMLMASVLLVLTVLIIVSIFSFRNMAKQMKIVAVAFLLNALMIGGIFYFADTFGRIKQTQVNYENIGMLFPFIILIFLVLSQRAIKQDQLKLKKSQRFR